MLPQISTNLACKVALTVGVAIASLSVSARASDLDQESPVQAQPDPGAAWQNQEGWNIILGAGGMYAPKFEGSDEFKPMPLPMFLVEYDSWLSFDPSGVKVDVYEANDFRVSGKAGIEMGRNDKDSSHLRGLGDVDFGGVIGAEVAYGMGPIEFYASVDKTVGGSDGLLGKLGTKGFLPLNDKLLLSADAYVTFADKNHMDAYFDVTAAQSAASGLARYDAGAGLKRADLEIAAMYLITDHWLVRGSAGVGVLLGDAADSPIVQEEIQPSAMLMLGYKF